MMKSLTNLISHWKLLGKVYYYKLKSIYFNRKYFFVWLKHDFLKESVLLSTRTYLKNYFSIKPPKFWTVYSYLIGVYFFLVYYYGFLSLLGYLENTWGIGQGKLLLLVAFIIFLTILPSGNFLVNLTSSLTYFLLVFLWWFDFRKTLDPGTFIGVFVFLVLVVRPLWSLLIKLLYFLLIKKIYHYSWFQKMLPHLSPNFDPREVREESKNKQKLSQSN